MLLAIFFAGQFYRVLSYTIMPFLKAQDQSVYAITFIIFWIIAFALLELFVGFIIKLVMCRSLATVEISWRRAAWPHSGDTHRRHRHPAEPHAAAFISVKNIFSSSILKSISVPTLNKVLLFDFQHVPEDRPSSFRRMFCL